MADTNTPNLPRNAGKSIGQSGTYITGGIITLEEYNFQLIGRRGLEQYDIMRRSDSSIRSVLQVVKLPILSSKWDVLAATIDADDPQAKTKQEVADYKARFMKREIMGRKVNFKRLIRDILTGLEFGFDVEEKNYEMTEFEGSPLVGIADISKRKQTTILNWEGPSGLPGVTQILPNNTVQIPMEKLVVFTHDMEGDNYEGISLLRYVYKDWDIKDKLTIVNAIAQEKQGLGIPKAVPRPNMQPSTTDLAKVEEILRNFRAYEEAYIQETETVGIEMMDMKANSTKEIIPTLNYHDGRISKSILAGFLEIGGHSGSGSQALAKDLTSLFMKSEEALANMIISTLQEQLVKQLCDLNWTDMSEGYPQLTVSNIGDDDLSGLASAISQLVTAGAVTPEADLEDHLREIFGLPQLPQEVKDNYQELRPSKTGQPAATPPPAVDDKTKTNLEQETNTKASALEQLKASRRKMIEIEYA